ncbi:hypothetical protein FK535_01445 [Mycolicibacterium sp. 018/SC-01/001]|uniref:hypothetical protein n=1 Tax=Mycolicibacterium sp. 018/SC-01/001 TaxID=2592069 RepID=UPI001180AEDF|nr:hypothetical protein [Mycolicibacterium sp. 018/SC-01/001]TRW88965.1 hypothetical protein FK535_01445 [Mycolicibacterium sp. 018/SC-01/001]
MGRPASRALAAAGALSLVIVFGGAGAVPALAQPSDGGDGSSQTSSDSGSGSSTSSGGSTDTSSNSSNSSGTSDSSGDTSSSVDSPEDSSVTVDTEPDTSSRIGGGSTREPADQEPTPPARESGKLDSGSTLTIPVLRLPAPGEIQPGQLPLPRNFVGTVQIPVPSLTEFLSALAIVPPAPPPGPAFRTQEEAPVVDASTGTAGAGGGSGGAGRNPAVLHAPLVVTVPRAITAAGGSPRAGLPVPDAVAAGPGATAPGVAGASTPAIRGSIEPTPGITARPLETAAGPRAEAMPRSLAGPTVAQIAAVALPGLAGLLLVTFGGGVLGYRQANSLRYVRTAGVERFLA